MPAGYNNQPISGFTGHLPGAKWQVGSRYVPPENINQNSSVDPVVSVSPHTTRLPRTNYGFSPQLGDEVSTINYTLQQQHIPDKSHITFQDNVIVDSNHGINSEMGGRQQGSPVSILRPGSSQMSVGYTAQGIPVRYPPHMQPGNSENARLYPTETSNSFSMPSSTPVSTPNMVRYNENPGSQPYLAQSHSSNGQFNDVRRHEQNNKTAEVQQRSRSIPRRRIEKDPFEGIEGGWWSKGEVLRNKERRELVNRGQTVLGGQYSYNLPSAESTQRQWQQVQKEEENDIPAAGYSGHIQGLRQLGIGKSFNAAAKEAKKEYFERRRARSGGREQFYDRSQSNYDISRSNNGHVRQDY
ncbi:unnamed protein product [Auanema sp. JU1783]|nr:unnamed protein product [Auanema sp. JU1783]